MAFHAPHHPVVDSALEYLRAEGCITTDGRRVRLTAVGQNVWERVAAATVLDEQKEAAAILKKKLTETVVKKMGGRA